LQKEDYQRRLDGVIERINGSMDKFRYDRKSLSTIIAGLQQFMEDAFGVNVSFFISSRDSSPPLTLFYSEEPYH
jgi:hypothetical protein